MTTAIRTFDWLTGSTANTGNVINGVGNMLTTVGLSFNDDTTNPQAASSADLGGMTFAFPDSLQSTTPIYIRLGYIASGGNIYMTAYVGSTKSGVSIASPYFTSSTGNGWTQTSGLNSYACYTDGSFGMVLGYGAAGSSQNANNCVLSLVVDRVRNTSGVAQSNGYIVEGANSSMSPAVNSRALYGPTSPDQMTSFAPSMVPSISAITSAEGANVNVFRHYSMTPGVRPHLGALTYFNSEFGALTPFTATVLGSAHTYMPMGFGMNYWSANPRVQHCCAIRWE